MELTVTEFDRHVINCKREFKWMLYCSGYSMDHVKSWVISYCFSRCHSKFEEDTMCENLAEVFREFIKSE